MTAWGWLPPADVAELLAILAAVDRGSPRGQWRQLDIVCASDHRLAEVFATVAGPVLYAWAYPVIPDRDAARVGGLSKWSREALAMRLFGPTPDRVALQCARCGLAEVPTAWIREQLTASRQRVMWSGHDGIL